jgi:hypothetical protein
MVFFCALERTFTKELTYEGMLEEERIARIGSNDPESHLGIPYSHVSANILRRFLREKSHNFQSIAVKLSTSICPIEPYRTIRKQLNFFDRENFEELEKLR